MIEEKKKKTFFMVGRIKETHSQLGIDFGWRDFLFKLILFEKNPNKTPKQMFPGFDLIKIKKIEEKHI